MDETAGPETAAMIAAKIAGYKEQLAQVAALSQAEPGNKVYAKLVTDLAQLITLTEELHEEKKREEASGGAAAAPVAVAAPAPAPVPVSRLRPSFAVGARVEVRYANKSWFAAIVEEVKEDGVLTVRIIASNKTDDVLSANCRTLKASKRAVPADEVAAGLRCQARYSQDGQWYNCKVDKETELGFQVTYTEYNNTEVVPLEYLRHMPKSTAEAAAVTADTFVVPEALVPLATDSEAEKTRKRKRIKMLKGKRRHIKLEAERDKKQASWQSFQAKTKKKKRTGFRTNLKKKSIFATSDNPEARVGVTGSGKGMTEFNAKRKITAASLAP